VGVIPSTLLRAPDAVQWTALSPSAAPQIRGLTQSEAPGLQRTIRKELMSRCARGT